MNKKIDFVIIWVDGSDQNWLNEKNKYSTEQNKKNNDNTKIRYRDWDNLKYWFRGVEKYAPWVNKIFFVTWGHLPEWLDINNPKLKIIKHEEFIPKEYLPTFSSHTIELNLHRIKELSENFVYFNDDFFIVNKTQPEDFFKNDIPRDSAVLYSNIAGGTVMDNIITNNFALINKNFNSKEVIKKNFFKWFTLKNGKFLYNNITLFPYKNFTGIRFEHLPNSFKKSTFKKVWKMEYEKLNETCLHKFRNIADINQWIFKYWQICEGNFIPRKTSWGTYYAYQKDNSQLKNIICSNKYKVICLNDISENYDFEKAKKITNQCFEKKLKEKSSFEK